MNAVWVTWKRTIGRMRGSYASALAIGVFLSLAAATFAVNFARAEGGSLPLAAVWAASVAPVLPVLAALLAMGVWSDERQSGRLAEMLSVAVRERDYVLGKFLGVWTVLMSVVFVSLAATVGALAYFAPGVFGAGALHAVFTFGTAVFALGVQGLLWVAVTEAASAFCRHAAAAAAISIGLLVVLPRALWQGLMRWSPNGASAFGEMPLDAHAVDFAMGSVLPGTLVSYFVVSAVFLLVATKCVAAARLVGRGARALRLSTGVVFALALVVAALSVRLALRFDEKVELPRFGMSSEFSARTREILGRSSGEIDVVCFLSRSDARFRPIGHLLRALAKASSVRGGARIGVSYVDPRWDVAKTEELAARGVAEASLVFRKSGRHDVVLPLKDGWGEGLCAAAISRLTTTARRGVYWSAGHGEAATDGYGLYGLSDVVRALDREGYRSAPIDLAATNAVPADCAFVVVSGPSKPFARAELDRLDAYLRTGGRLLVLQGPTDGGGLAALLASWGVQSVPATLAGAKTLSGSDVIVTDFSDHAIVAPLKGSRIVLERPTAFRPSDAAAGSGADISDYAPLASLGDDVLAVAVKRGAPADGNDILRPTRLVVIGDATFALNGALASRGNANYDFFRNCAAFLAGAEISGASDEAAGSLVSGLDRAARARFAAVTVGVVPGLVFLLLAGVTLKRRLRT